MKDWGEKEMALGDGGEKQPESENNIWFHIWRFRNRYSKTVVLIISKP